MKWIIKTANHSKGLVQDEINSLIKPSYIEWLHDCVAIVETNEETISRIVESSGTAKIILSKPVIMKNGELITNIKNEKFSAHDLNIDHIIESGTFAVRHEHTGNLEKKLPTEWVERRLGAQILSFRNDLCVSLKNPEFKLIVISWQNGSCLGWLHATISFDSIAARAPKMGPYFRGGGMKPRLCRTLVNLLYPMSSLVLDPFCGHGGILREIADIGSFALGIEINKKLCRELLANNRYFGYDDVVAIIMGDSIHQPLRKSSYTQAITDPPYAIQTTTKGLDREDLLLKWLYNQNIGLKFVFTTPNTMLPSLPSKWVVDLDQEDYVHRSLTRRIRRATCKGDKT
ncbi:MAG: hypothetical protein ACC656_02750 [Candidatus Heimdallarchaeota archaeon]